MIGKQLNSSKVFKRLSKGDVMGVDIKVYSEKYGDYLNQNESAGLSIKDIISGDTSKYAFGKIKFFECFGGFE